MPVREASTQAGEGRLIANFTLVRLGPASGEGRTPGVKQASVPADAAKRALLARKERLEQQIDVLKYQRAALPPDEYKQKITAALVELARVQEALDK